MVYSIDGKSIMLVMERLSKIMTTKPTVNLFNVQMHLLKDNIVRNGGKSVQIHKFLYRFDYKGEIYYLKVNLADNLFFLFTRTSSGTPRMFQSMIELRRWFKRINNLKSTTNQLEF
jgi:hypothetical protein